MPAAIEMRGVTVRYGAVTAVERLDLSVECGSVFGFLGPNGAGKTSAIRTMVDLLRPDEGTASVLGVEVRGGGGALRRSIGFLPGDLSLFPDLTGEETLALFSRLQGRPPRDRERVLRTLGFPDGALPRRVRTYSTGMRQMVGIAAAFQHRPEVLILDEPTSGLDPLVRDAFLGLVRAVPARGATVLLSSHVLAEVETCADRVALIYEGRLLFEDSLEELRRARPRRVVVRYEDGREVRSTHAGSPAQLLAALDTDGLVDLEIRPVGLDEIVRSVIEDRKTP